MKILIMGDYQVYARPRAYETESDMLDNSLRALEQVFGIAADNACNMIFCTGDFFEHQTPSPSVTNRVIQKLQQLHGKYKGVELHCITGNHDYAAGTPIGDEKKPNRTILQVVQKACPNFIVADYKGYELGNGHAMYCVPFMRNEREWLAYMQEQVELPFQHTLLLMHQDTAQEIPGSEIDEQWLAEHFTFVFNGHIHRRVERHNFITVGSLLQQKQNDITDVSKGVYIFDSTTPKIEFIEVSGYPVFREYYAGDEVAEEHKGDYIIRRERPIEVAPNLRTLDDTTPKGREDVGRVFLAEKLADIPQDLEGELAALTARVQGSQARVCKTIRYVSLEVHGYRSWLHGVYDLDPQKLQYIQAKTGSGKSSLFEAIAWCEFGTLLKDKALQADVTPEKWLQNFDPEFKGTMVRVVKEVDGQRYEMARCLSYKGDVHGQRGADGFYVHEIAPDGTATPVDPLKLGLNVEEWATKNPRTAAWAQYCGVDSAMFLNSVIFTPEKCNLVQATDAEKRLILEPLLGVDWVDRLKDLAGAERVVEEGELIKLTTEENRADERVQGAILIIAQIEQQEKSHDAQRDEDAKELEDKIVKNLALVPEYQSDVDQMKSQVALSEAKLDPTITAKMAQAQQELADMQQKGFARTEELSRMKNDMANIKAVKSPLWEEIQISLDNLRTERGEKQEEYNGLRQKVANLKYEIQQLTPTPTLKRLGLEAEGRLTERKLQEVTGNHATHVATAQKERGKLEVKKSTLSVLQKDLEHKSEDCPVCGQHLPEGHNILAELEQHRQRVVLLESEIAEITADIEGVEKAADSLARQMKEMQEEMEATTALIQAEVELELKELEEVKVEKGVTLTTIDAEMVGISTWLEIYHPKREVILKDDQANEWRECEARAAKKIAAATLGIVKMEGEHGEWKIANILPIENRIALLQGELQQQGQYQELLDARRRELAEAEGDMRQLETVLTTQRESLAAIKARVFDKAKAGLPQAEARKLEQEGVLEGLKLQRERRERRKANLQQIEKSVCGARGLKAMLIQQKLERVNAHAQVYADRIGTSIRFHVDDSGGYRCTLMIDGHERDARKASNGQLAVANLIFAGALKDLQSETADIRLQMLDEPFGALDPEYIFTISQLLSLQAQKRAMHVITHATELDMTNSDIIRIEGGTKLPSKFVN